MPAPGAQHTTVVNPFNEPLQRVSEFTAQQIATLQCRLEKQLGPEYLSARVGPSGQRVHYIAAEKVISLANEVFGFNGWSSSIKEVQVDFVDEHPQTLKISLGLSVIVRVTLRDGTFHEDIGYGHIENCKGKAAAFEKAKKEGTTDALKRALRNFGNLLGNCIYDKSYVEKVTKMKATPIRKFQDRELYRHADYAVKVEPKVEEAAALPNIPAAAAAAGSNSRVSTTAFPSDDDLFGEFDEADFCVGEEDTLLDFHVAEATVPSLMPPQNQQARSTSPVRQFQGAPKPPANAAPPRPPQTPNANVRAMNNAGANRPYQPGNNQAPNRPQLGSNVQQGAAQRPGMNGKDSGNGAGVNGSYTNAAAAGNGSKPAIKEEGTPWLSARAIAKVSDDDALAAVASSVQADHLFNPRTESPSIRKTPGIDHSSSRPVPRTTRPAAGRAGFHLGSTPPLAKGPAPVNTSAAGGHGGPQGSMGGMGRGMGTPGPETRRIGAPPVAASPLANRGQFRPPPMKRGPPTDAAANRPALSEVPANVPGNAAAGMDAKRPRLA